MKLKFLIFWVLFAAFSLTASSAIRMPAIFSDNMVLQQKSEAPVWGWANPGETVSVKGNWNNTSVSAKADKNGKWMVKLKTPPAGGPYTLTITGKEILVFHNVLIGEVWVCSGQSNMEMPVGGWPGAPILNSASAIQAADFPHIRLFTVPRDIALLPQEDCKGTWAVCSPETVKNFSATAYFFGKELYEKLKVPIGLIHSSWGGTVAEAWTSEQALRKLGDFNAALDKQKETIPHLDELRKQGEQNEKIWAAKKDKVNAHYATSGFNDGSWKSMTLPKHWEAAGLPDYDGIVWFRRAVDVPAAWAGKELQLALGPVDDEDITWFNGKKVGSVQEEGHWAESRSYTIPGGLVRAGRNIIAVRVTDLRGNGGIYGDANQMCLYPTGDPGTKISLAGDWKYNAVLKKPATPIANNPNAPTVLYNGMIAPIIPFAIKGAIWYQGEANVGRAAQYARLFPAMITDWRNRWQEGNFPFYFVQIAPFPYNGDGTQSAALRDAQRRTLSLPATGMAVTLDIGDTTNIHPANKEEVGRRLSLWALANTYGVDGLVYSGPLYSSMEVKGNKAIISFNHVNDGLAAKGGALTGFEIAGKDGHFVPANAKIEGDHVVVSANDIEHPVAVRYAWRDNAVPHLFNKAGLPASSFTTEALR